jgi:predicted nucleotidyltransferase
MNMPRLGMKREGQRRRSLADSLLTKTQQRILRLLFGQPERAFYASEVIRTAGTGSGAAQRELKRLADGGLIETRRVGNQRHFQANPASPIFAELRSIVLKTVSLVEPLRGALERLSAIRAAFVYGSVAQGTDRSASDIDLMVVGDDLTYGDVYESLRDVEPLLTRRVNPTVYSTAEFEKRVREGNAFLRRVLEQPKLWVIGSEHDIAT